MAGFISQETIDYISQQADIVEIISEYLPLTRSGRNYKALCPFHEEKTPSFIVSPEKQIFHCFGCGVGGNVFTFVMKWERISFPEAVKVVAQKLGISISLEEEKEGKQDFYRINAEIADFFHQQLKKNKVAQSYLSKRGINSSTIEKFKLGWAPPSNIFLDFCKRRGFSEENLEKLGLLKRSSQGEWYPYFKERIMFPIFSISNRVIAFGARVIDDRSLPKYLNSPQSPLFDKGKNLYGLNLAKDEIRKSGEVILVEGYTDVITLYQEGITNVVASLGTSLTLAQAHLLKRYAKKVFIAYDEDSAGKIATIRGIDLLLENELQVEVISLPEGKDPAEFVGKNGREAFLKEKNKALSYIDYRIKTERQKSKAFTLDKKLEIVNSLFSTLKKVKSRYLLDEHLKKISETLGLNEESLRSEFIRFCKEKGNFSFSVLGFKTLQEEEIEKKLLQVIICDEEALQLAKKSISPADFTHPLCRRAAEEIFSHEGKITPSVFLNRIKDDKICSLISSLSFVDSSFEGVNLQEAAREIIRTLKRRLHQKRIEQLTRMIKSYEKQGKEEKLKELYEQIVELKKNILI